MRNLSLVSIWSLPSLRKKTSAIAAIIRKPLSSDRSDSDHWDRTFYISEIIATAITEIFFSVMAAITAVVVIIWKPGLSYASVTKYVLITIILSKQERCIMLFTFSCFNCQNEKGLLNFVSERIKLVYGLTLLGTTCKKISCLSNI